MDKIAYREKMIKSQSQYFTKAFFYSIFENGVFYNIWAPAYRLSAQKYFTFFLCLYSHSQQIFQNSEPKDELIHDKFLLYIYSFV